MKRIATLAVILLLGFAAQAHSVRYFTYNQAQRVVRYLNPQNELMIYCGYDYEIETYVLVNEVWMERVNSAYYEIWLYGYDAYTGDEIYMPLDLGCVWLFSAGRVYNAAQYLRFHVKVQPPQFAWSVPSYNHFTRVMHRPGYVVTYHYDIHRHGWMPPAPHHHGPGMPPPLPPYYMRTPGTPAPRPQAAWTPGVDRPVVVTGSVHTETGRTTTGGAHTQPTGRSTSSNGVRTGGNSSATTSVNSRPTGTTSTNTRSTGTTPTRGNVPATKPNTDTAATGAATNTRTTTSGTRTSGTTNTRGTSGNTNTRTSGNSTNTRTSGTSSTGTRTSGTTNTRGTSSGTSASDKTGTTTRTSGTTASGTRTTATATGTRTSGSAARPQATEQGDKPAATNKPKTNTRTR